MIYKADDVPTLNQIASSLWDKLGMGLRYLASHNRPLSMAPSQLGAFARSDPQQPSANPECHIQSLSLDRSGGPLHAFPVFITSVCNLHPHNRGTMRIRSLDSGETPSIQPSYLSDPRDLKATAGAVRLARHVAAAPTLAAFRPQEHKSGPGYCSEEDL